MFFKIGILKNFANLTLKYLGWSLFLIKFQACNFIKNRLQQRCFTMNIAEFLRTDFYIEHLWWLPWVTFALNPSVNCSGSHVISWLLTKDFLISRSRTIFFSSIKKAMKLQPNIIFVPATKIDKNVSNILNCYFWHKYTLWHIKVNIYM